MDGIVMGSLTPIADLQLLDGESAAMRPVTREERRALGIRRRAVAYAVLLRSCAGIKAIVAEHGEGHLITVVRCIRETRANREEMWSETILAISDILAARPEWRDTGGALLDAFDAIPLKSLRESAVALRPWPVRSTLRVMLYVRLDAGLSPLAAAA